MLKANDESLERIACDVLVERCGARVVIRRAVRRVYDALTDRQRGRFLGIMCRWCEDPRALPPDMFNPSEGRSNRHNILLQAFKIRKVRLYGFGTTIDEKKSFLIVDADPAKKQNRGEPRILNRSRNRVDDISDEINAKGKRHGR